MAARRGYARLSNGLWADDKAMSLYLDDPQAFGMWILSISYCSDLMTDGELSSLALRRLMCPKNVEDTLIARGFWERKRGGNQESIWVHSYLHWQSNRDAITHAKTMHADRQKRYRSRQANTVTRHVTGHTSAEEPKPKPKHTSSLPSSTITMTRDWHPTATIKTAANQWEGLDTEVALAEYTLHWLGQSKTQAQWDKLWQGWILHRVQTKHLHAKPPHQHTWKCEHTLHAAGMSADDAGNHIPYLNRIAQALNNGNTPQQALEHAQQATKEKTCETT